MLLTYFSDAQWSKFSKAVIHRMGDQLSKLGNYAIKEVMVSYKALGDLLWHGTLLKHSSKGSGHSRIICTRKKFHAVMPTVPLSSMATIGRFLV
jgi:hypothetical protein